MKIAVEGCAHGELENIYGVVEHLQEKENIKIDLLLCCGDFQTSRNEEDLRCMAVPPKYYNICSFYKYYSGEKRAPILTILIGGNHEASNYLQELPYGGWVAPNIYYLGYGGVINVAGIRIAGLSGIYKGRDYMKGHFEKAPYDENSKRSVYHIRNLEVFRLKQLSGSVDIFLSHDWPTNVWKYGNADQLLRFKPHFKDDMESGQLGSEPCEEILKVLKPVHWFAAHLHCKFAAVVPHENNKSTRFLALDKCLPKRRFLQVLDLEHDGTKNIEIEYDLEWLAILLFTNHLLSVKTVINYMPSSNGNERYNFTPTPDEKNLISAKFDNNLIVPKNFEKTAASYSRTNPKNKHVQQPSAVQNPQTVLFCKKLGVDDPVEIISTMKGVELNKSFNESLNEDQDLGMNNTTFIDDTLTDNSINHTPSPTKRMPVLNLPEPKNDSKIPPDTDSTKIETLRSEFVTSEVIDQTLESVQNETREQPAIKKLKRRNALIYENEDI